MMNFNMAQSSSANLQEKPDSLTGVSPFWLKPSACAPNNWEDWLIKLLDGSRLEGEVRNQVTTL